MELLSVMGFILIIIGILLWSIKTLGIILTGVIFVLLSGIFNYFDSE
jgi:hypothetical protein